MKIKSIVFLIFCLFLTSCNGCSKSAQKYKNIDNKKSTKSNTERAQKTPGKTIIKMEKRNGVYYVPVELNDSKMDFIFDTGAGIISISETEAMFLIKQGRLTENDIKGTSNFIDANGVITEGTIVNLKTVKIGGITLHNIEASVVPNAIAPLLLGQSAFERFGKISIDYKRGEITLE